MVNTEILKKAYSEVDEFLEILGNEYKSQIPISLRNYIKKEKDINYKKGIDLDTPRANQNLMKDTLEIIAFLNLKYWCKDETEKQRLREKYRENEKENEQKLKQKFDTNQLFKSKEDLPKENKIALVVKKESWISKLKKIIINMFFRK